MVSLLSDVFSSCSGIVPTFVFLMMVVTIFLGACNLYGFCRDRLRAFWMSHPLDSLPLRRFVPQARIRSLFEKQKLNRLSSEAIVCARR